VRRNWLAAAIVAAVVVIVAAVVIARVADDDSGSLDTTAWADSVCSSLSDWQSSIASLADVSGTLSRDSLREKLDDADAATEKLVADLRDLGAPDTAAGDELEQELDSAADELETSYESLKEGAQEALDTDSPTDFLRALADLAPDVQGLLTTIATTIDTLENSDAAEASRDEIRQAFEDADSCQDLGAGED